MNKLENEKSPYLLQHAENPVTWYPWCNEAFERAKTEDKPIFLSIGYSTCHWCHVMAHESFEDNEVAGLMNEYFISIKVDREERPDIDGIYMNVCQMLTGSGGWPLTIIMTPEKKPFFAGTYFPKESKFGRMGMSELLPRIAEIWKNKRTEILKSSEEIYSAISNSADLSAKEDISPNIFDKSFEYFSSRFDREYGGFGNAPKFPTPHNLFFLLRYWKQSKNPEALEIVEKTLLEMRKGGIYDHIGFGFHRYSTDQKWLVPHFEKMLYDQALIAIAYVEAFQITKKNVYKYTAEEILEYVIRDLTSPEGGFYSAEDADSDGEEGKFYLWAINELEEILTESETEICKKVFNLEDDGNWIDQMHGAYNGTNILHLVKSKTILAEELDLTENELENKLNTIRNKLFEFREARIHPYKDDKILTDWNSLMISAFAKAAQAFNNKKYEEIASKAANFIFTKLMDNNGNLYHRYREDEAGINANLDDYAFLVNSLVDLYETNFDTDYLKKALELNKILIENFWDDENGGFFFTSKLNEEILTRRKEIYDSAIPSGNSIALLNLLRLNRITGISEYENKALKLTQTFSSQINSSPFAFTQALLSLYFIYGDSFEIVIAGSLKSFDTIEILKTIRKKFIPNKVILLHQSNDAEIEAISSYIKSQNQIEGKVTGYICKDFKCNFPVTDLSEMMQLLGETNL